MSGVSFVARTRERVLALWRLAKNERGSPRQLAIAVALGVFVGCSPALGVHTLLALGLATLFRVNRLWTWIGSRMCNLVTLPFIVYAQVQVAHRLRTGAWMDLDRSKILEQVDTLFVDWLLGMLVVGSSLSLLFGLVAFTGFTIRDRRRAGKEALLAAVGNEEPSETFPGATE